MIRQSKANAVWRGGLKDGKGTVSVDSGVLSNTAYTFAQRFEAAKGTNPEELIAAAHVGCFSMALSAELGKANLVPETIESKATLDLDTKDGKPTSSDSGASRRVPARVPIGLSEQRRDR